MRDHSKKGQDFTIRSLCRSEIKMHVKNFSLSN